MHVGRRACHLDVAPTGRAGTAATQRARPDVALLRHRGAKGRQGLLRWRHHRSAAPAEGARGIGVPGAASRGHALATFQACHPGGGRRRCGAHQRVGCACGVRGPRLSEAGTLDGRTPRSSRRRDVGRGRRVRVPRRPGGAAEWMQNHGLEWAHRLFSEPRRLWRRYLFTNIPFLFMGGAQWLASRISGARPAARPPVPAQTHVDMPYEPPDIQCRAHCC